jgi:acetyltransferase-like isoleucine patch superfamily enzyme
MLPQGTDVVYGENVVVFPGAVLGKRPMGPGLSRQPSLPDDPRVHLGNGCVIGANAVIYAGVTIGAGTLIGDGVVIREDVQIGEMSVIGSNSTVNAHTRIGSRVKIMDLTHITADALIEDDVFISTGVLSTNDNAMGREGYTGHFRGPTIRSGRGGGHLPAGQGGRGRCHGGGRCGGHPRRPAGRHGDGHSCSREAPLWLRHPVDGAACRCRGMTTAL